MKYNIDRCYGRLVIRRQTILLCYNKLSCLSLETMGNGLDRRTELFRLKQKASLVNAMYLLLDCVSASKVHLLVFLLDNYL